MANRERKNQVPLYFSDYEMELLKKNMEKSGIENRSAYIRKMSIDGVIINTDLKILKDLSYEINKIGTNINQVTKHLNEMQNISKEDVESLKVMLKSINLMQRDCNRKFNNFYNSSSELMKISDRLCRENNLSVIVSNNEKGKHYKEWQE